MFQALKRVFSFLTQTNPNVEKSFIDDMSAEYDRVIIDTPPVLASTKRH